MADLRRKNSVVGDEIPGSLSSDGGLSSDQSLHAMENGGGVLANKIPSD